MFCIIRTLFIKFIKMKEKELSKPLTKVEVIERYSSGGFFNEHPDYIYKRVWELFPRVEDIDTKSSEYKLIEKWGYLDSFKRSHIFVWEGLSGNIILWAVELINNLIEEYNCNSTLEQSLCEIIGLNYWKVMQVSKKFTTVMDAWEYLDNDRTRLLSVLSKELDRANRTYLISLNNLINIKRPQMKINIKTKNAFFWEKQQFNNNQQDKWKND